MTSLSNDLILYFLFAVATGLLFSLIVYGNKKNHPWPVTTTFLLGFLRFICVFGITFLLFTPKFSRTTIHEEKPINIFLEDNSNSIRLAMDSIELSKAIIAIDSVKKTITGKVITEKLVETTNNNLAAQSPISSSLSRVKDKYQGQNINSITLVTDGINNIGRPINQQFIGLPVHTIALGKKITQKDIFVKKIKCNRSVFLGNDFLVKADITANGYEGQLVTLILKNKNNIVESKVIKIVNNSVSYTKLLHAQKKGRQNYTLSVKPMKDEITTVNNDKTFTVNIVAEQKKVLIYAQSPHPSIKMLHNIINKDERYNCVVKFSYDKLKKKECEANLYVLCGSPKIPSQLAESSKNLGIIYFPLGSNKKIDLDWFTYLPKSTKPDEVRPRFNAKFSSFIVEKNNFSIFSNTQPLEIPFGEVYLNKGTPLLLQTIESLNTQKPLIAVQDVTLPHQAVILGEGWWRMKLHENNNESQVLEELFFKLMDFCTSTKNEEGLHFNFEKNHYYDIESPKTHAYFTTKSGERKHNLPLTLQLNDLNRNKKYDYSFILFSDRIEYKLNTLPKGQYSYVAKASADGKTFTKKGFITIKENNLESINLNINEVGLRQLAINNGGQFAFYDSLSTFVIESGKTRLSESISYKDVIDYKWIFALLLLLIFSEWIVRKIKGSY